MRRLLLMGCLCLLSCSIFKRTAKTKAVETGELEKIVDSRSLVLKTALRETNTLTYNPDGSILQFQQVQEEIAQSQAVQVLAQEKLRSKKEAVTKEGVPLKGWVWFCAFVSMLLAVVAYLKFIR